MNKMKKRKVSQDVNFKSKKEILSENFSFIPSTVLETEVLLAII